LRKKHSIFNYRTNKTARGRRKNCLAAAIFCLLTAAFSVAAATSPAEYKTKLQTARQLTGELQDQISEAADLSEIDAVYEKKIIGEIRASVPVSEKIEWQGAEIETDNQWLSGELGAYAEQNDLSKRGEILTAIGERLAALEEKTAELENPVAGERTKDEDKRKLAEILRREQYQKPEQKQESFLQRWWRELLDWFAESFPRPKISDEAVNGTTSISFVLQILLYALVLGVIGFVIYRFAPAFLKNRRARAKSAATDRVILGERIADGETAENLFGKAEALAREGDLRAAIRQGYVALLCDLSDRRIIGLAQHKTNRDYLRDVRPNAPLYENMSKLTGSFERHWYGSQKAAETDWNEFREKYDRIRAR
jgi:hypothetical protein